MFQNALFHPGADAMRVELDKKSLFALASDTRLEILRSLQPMRRTVSQLSESLGIDKAAVHRHLKKMEEGGLVKRFEDHGFVYYGLSWKARDLLSPNENTRIIVLLSSSWLLVLGIVFLVALGAVLGATDHILAPRSPELSPGYGDGTTGGEEATERFALLSFQPSDVLWILPSALFGALAIVLAVLAVRTMRKPKLRTAKRAGSERA
ncbi:MAG: winged helix-turn-helix domain-containing protein [Thermoplasmata archaeon]